MYCILGKVNTEFKKFIFPIETKIECILNDLAAKPAKKYKMDLIINFYQRDQLCLTVTLDVSFHKKSFMLDIESGLLEKVIDCEMHEFKQVSNA